jgi:CRP-like cAMP-binding protein
MNATNQVPMFQCSPGPEWSRSAIEDDAKFHPFLQDFKAHHRRLLQDAARPVHFEAGEVVFREGEPADGIYLIQTGKVQLEAFAWERGLVPIQTLSSGDVMGWSWLFPPYFWRFGARALEATNALFIHGLPLRNECESDHDFGYEVMKRLAEIILKRLQAARTHMAENGAMANPLLAEAPMI